jgi:hypothetical protein
MATMKRQRAVLRGPGRLIVLCLLAGTTAASAGNNAADKAMLTIHPESIRANMSFLADDLLEGRGTATHGYELAARFMATRFESLGLKPAGDDGSFFQKVPLVSMKPDGAKSALTFVSGGAEQTLTYRKDYITPGDPARDDTSIDAPVVYVGFGVTAPAQGYDDYRGIDAKGKIVALIFGAPGFESSLKAHYSSAATKAANAVVHGAVGIIALDTPALEQLYSFDKRVRDLANPQFRWLNKLGQPNDYFPELKGRATLSLAATQKFFEGSGHTSEEVFAAVKAGKPTSFPLQLTAKIHNVTIRENVQSPNVVAKLEGRDPELKKEYLVYTAHLDHLGIGEPVKDDKIYNGALDNASGSAVMLEIAKAFLQMNPAPRRSILFVSVTGEEAGLLGSDYFAHNPTVDRQSLVANVNMDEVPMFWKVEDIVAFGAEHSTLNTVVKEAAARMHLTISPDPLPEEVVFIRSDQYSFVRQGIPAVMPCTGFISSDPKIKPMEIFMNWIATRYHQPQDDMQQPGLDFDAAATYARFAFLCGYLITEEKQRPAWYKGDFFGDLYGKN